MSRQSARARQSHARTLRESSLAAGVDALLVPAARGWNVLLPLRGPTSRSNESQIDTQRVRTAVEQAAPGRALLVDLKSERNALYSGYLGEAVHLSLAGLGAIIVLLLIALRSPTRVQRTVTPLLLSVLTVAAALVLCGRQLTILHLVGMLLIVAVGSNYSSCFSIAREPRAARRRI